MFLDDKLFQIAKNTKISQKGDLQILLKKLFLECRKYYEENFTKFENISGKETKALLDRAFNYWNLFAERAIKEGGEMKILGELFKEVTFKKYFFENEELKKLYNSL
jgi:hypothetical protein